MATITSINPETYQTIKTYSALSQSGLVVLPKQLPWPRR